MAGADFVFDAALVDSTEDLKISIVAPLVVPAVGNQPVGLVVFDAPAQDLDGVALQQKLISEMLFEKHKITMEKAYLRGPGR